MKTRLYIILCMLCCIVTGQAQPQYQMDVEMKDGSITSYLMASIRDVGYESGYTVINVRGRQTYTSKRLRSTDIKTISWKRADYSPAINTNNFQLDELHRAVVTPQYTVNFDAGCIDGDQTLTVKKAKGLPQLQTEDLNVSSVVAYDFDLGGQHELNGVVEIRLPMRVSSGSVPVAAYYNRSVGEWQPVNHYYDNATGELVIKTSHLSEYAGFEIEKKYTRGAWIKGCYIPTPLESLDFYAKMLAHICYSDNPAGKLMDEFANQASTAQSLGLDVTYQALLGLGLNRPNLDEFTDILGNLGTVLSVYQIIRSDYEGNDAQVAGQSLKLCMSQAMAWATHYCGNAILRGSLASVAMLDYALNKFATTAWEGRKDIYRAAYDMYYSKGHEGYRGPRDWFNVMWPIFQRKELTGETLNAAIDQEVQNYVWKFWNDESVVSYYMNQAKNMGWTGGGGLNESIKRELSNNYREQLYDGYLKSVFRAIKNRMEDQMYDQCMEQMEKYTKELNKVVMLSFSDSEAKDGKSRYAYCKVRFKNMPESILDKEAWELRLLEDGSGSLSARVFAMFDMGLTPEIEVVNGKGDVLLELELKNLRFGYTKETARNEIDLAEYKAEEVLVDQYLVTIEPSFKHIGLPEYCRYIYAKQTHEWSPHKLHPADGIYYDNWTDGVTEVMRSHKTVKPDADGTINFSDAEFKMTGTYDKELNQGEGTFRITKKFSKEVLTMEQVRSIFSDFDNHMRWIAENGYVQDSQQYYNQLMDGEMEQAVEGTFTVYKLRERYIYTFRGTGTYALDANIFSEVINSTWTGQALTLNGPLEIVTGTTQANGTVAMEYRFSVKE